VKKIVIRSAAFFDLQAQASVEGLFARTADPEVALAGLAHLDHPLFHGARSRHYAVNLQTALDGQMFGARKDFFRRRGQPGAFRGFPFAGHSTFLPPGRAARIQIRRVGGVFGTHRLLQGWVPKTPPTLLSSQKNEWLASGNATVY